MRSHCTTHSAVSHSIVASDRIAATVTQLYQVVSQNYQCAQLRYSEEKNDPMGLYGTHRALHRISPLMVSHVFSCHRWRILSSEWNPVKYVCLHIRMWHVSSSLLLLCFIIARARDRVIIFFGSFDDINIIVTFTPCISTIPTCWCRWKEKKERRRERLHYSIRVGCVRLRLVCVHTYNERTTTSRWIRVHYSFVLFLSSAM